MRAIAVLDPLAPLCWRGVALWPDGIGTALAVAQAAIPTWSVRLEEIVIREEAGNWAVQRPDRCDFTVVRVEARQQHSWLRQRSPGASAAAGLPAEPTHALCEPIDGRAMGGAAARIAAGSGGNGRAQPIARRPSRSTRNRGLHLRATERRMEQ